MLTVLLPLAAVPSATQAETRLTLGGNITLTGDFTQGGLVIGSAPPGSTVKLNGQDITQWADGRFLLGFGREAQQAQALTILLPEGKTLAHSLTIMPRTFQTQRIDGLPDKMVHPPQEVLDRIRQDNQAVGLARRHATPIPLFDSGFIWPALGRISGVYGSTRILNGQPRRPHFGIDIAAPEGTPVIAPAGGIVRLAHPDMYYTGKTLILDHGYGLSSTFLHMDSMLVREDQKIMQGQVIGTIGSTGRSTGPHLDWRINLFSERLDPELIAKPKPVEGHTLIPGLDAAMLEQRLKERQRHFPPQSKPFSGFVPVPVFKPVLAGPS